MVVSDPEHGDCLVTAPEGAVLRGTIQQVVLRLAMQAGLRVTHDFPRASEVATWRGAFITSTSRLVLPVDRVRFRHAPSVVHAVPLHPKVDRLRELVRDDVRTHSTRVL